MSTVDKDEAVLVQVDGVCVAWAWNTIENQKRPDTEMQEGIGQRHGSVDKYFSTDNPNPYYCSVYGCNLPV